MSILLRKQIKREIKKGKIIAKPFNQKLLQINSIDVTLFNKLVTYIPLKIIDTKFGKMVEIDKEILIKEDILFQEQNNNILLDLKKENKTFEIEIPEEGLILLPNILYLGSTNEKVGSSYFVPMYDGRSSMARLGIQSHISAGFGDLNFASNWTLEITVVHPVKIVPNFRIGQVYFHKVGKKSLKTALNKKIFYKGKYLKQTTPQSSKSFQDFN